MLTSVGRIYVLALLLAFGCKSGSDLRDKESSTPDPSQPGRNASQAVSHEASKAEEPTPRDAQPRFDNHKLYDALGVDCPQKGGPSFAEALDSAGEYYHREEYASALACAEKAIASAPLSIAAHHLRAAALAALGRLEEALKSFVLAVALDPDDPETLVAAADFYVNMMPPDDPIAAQIGLEYASRGSLKAGGRRRDDQNLRARLALLESEALSNLGRADEALARAEAALEFRPKWSKAMHEVSMNLYALGRFKEALVNFEMLAASDNANAYAFHHMGIISERLGHPVEAESYFNRAIQMAPLEFFKAPQISDDDFDGEVRLAISEMKEETQKKLGQIEIEIVDHPDSKDLSAVHPPFSPSILGLYRGHPVEGAEAPTQARPGPRHDASSLSENPARSLVLYRRNIIRTTRTRGELNEQIRRTLAHEIGHMDGYSESQLRKMGLD